MQNFDEIKDLWLKNTTAEALPSAKEIMQQIEGSRKKAIRKNVLLAITLGLTFLFIVLIGYYYDFKLWTTAVGIILVLIAIVIGIFFNTKLVLLLLKQGDPMLDNKNFLHQLVTFRANQRFIQTKGLSLYFILLSAGIFLYMFEFAVRDITFGLVAYLLTLAWIALNWFYFRKKAIAKQEKEINGQISMIEKLISNLES